MNRRSARVLTRVYPRTWRERYAREFTDFLEQREGGFRVAINVLKAAISERMFPTVGGTMQQDVVSFGSILKQPGAFLPLAFSLGALATVAVAARLAGMHGTHLGGQPDEGSAAHIWQLLMVAQIPIVLWFAFRWLKRAPRLTLRVLALQAGAWLAACTPVYFLHL